MKKYLVGLWLIFILPAIGISQSCTVDEISQQIPLAYKIIEFPLDQGKSQLIPIIDTISSTYSLAKLINNHPTYIAYLSATYSVVQSSYGLPPGIDLKEANRMYHQALINDTLFNRHFLTMAAYYLQAQGITVKLFPLPAKPVLTMPTLMQIASHFFERLETAANGRVLL